MVHYNVLMKSNQKLLWIGKCEPYKIPTDVFEDLHVEFVMAAAINNLTKYIKHARYFLFCLDK